MGRRDPQDEDPSPPIEAIPQNKKSWLVTEPALYTVQIQAAERHGSFTNSAANIVVTAENAVKGKKG
jgi:hypothetical protein